MEQTSFIHGRPDEDEQLESRLKTQFSITEIIALSENIEIATCGILKAICHGMRWEVGEFWALDPESNELRLNGFWSETSEIRHLESFNRNSKFRKGVGTPGHVWATGEPLWSVDVRHDACFHRKQLAEQVGLQGSLAFPVSTGKDFLGTMVFFTRQTRFEEMVLARVMSDIGTQFAHFLLGRRNEAALRASEEKFRLAFEDGPVGLALLDEEMRFASVNAALCKMLGVEKAHLSKQTFLEVLHPEDRQPASKLKEHLSSGEFDRYESELRFVSKTGETLWGKILAKLIREANSKCVRVFTVIEDVTVRKATDRQLQEYLKKLSESNRDLSEFTRIASHDLNEPLNTIGNFLSLISRKMDLSANRQVAEYFDFVTSAAARMRDLMGNLLTYAKVEHADPEFGNVELSDSLTSTMENLDDLIKRTGAEVHSSPLPRVLGDRHRLSQVFQNLISNAIKYCDKPAPRIEISCDKVQSEILISIRDNGPGISPEYLDVVFLPFRRLHTSSAVAGSGLGLPICKRIVESHGGRIWVKSAPGLGSTFSFTLKPGS